MKRKPEIFDVVFYYNEKNTLQKRIKYLETEVSKFFIVNFSKTSVEIDNPKVEEIFFDGKMTLFLDRSSLCPSCRGKEPCCIGTVFPPYSRNLRLRSIP
jgi:hypothetical protein